MGCGGFTCSKNALAALNVLYILVAFILIGVASYGRAVAIITSISVLSGIIVCGVFLLFIAFIGLIGAVKHHQVLLFFYMIILFLIFLVQFAVACALLAVNQEQQQQMTQTGWKSAEPGMKSFVQKKFDCCGFDSKNQGNFDMENMGHPICGPQEDKLPCCANSNADCCTGVANSTTEGATSNSTCPCDACFEKLADNIDTACKVSGGIGLFFSFTEIFGVWITVRYRNQKDPRANPSAFL